MGERSTGNIVKQSQRNGGVCACGRAEKRPGQGNCRKCHRVAQASYRARRKIEFEELKAANFAREMSRIAKGVRGTA